MCGIIFEKAKDRGESVSRSSDYAEAAGVL